MPTEEKKLVEPFEGFTTPGPKSVETGEPKALEAWNEPAFIESVAAEGFPGSSVHTDEGFRYHLSHFASGGAARSSAKKEEPEEEPEKRSHHKKER